MAFDDKLDMGYKEKGLPKDNTEFPAWATG